ncbi:MAG: DUF1587 domain-containing protein, partial [Planctomycetota bacterium]
MRSRCLSTVLAAALVVSCTSFTHAAEEASWLRAQAHLNEYCVDCHTTDDPAGERDFEGLSIKSPNLLTLERLQEAVDQLTLGTMPPPDTFEIDDEERVSMIEDLTIVLRSMQNRLESNGGRSVLRRLNRREYRNSLRDLLLIDDTMFDPTSQFPRDQRNHHRDNVGDALVMSGNQLSLYLDAATAAVDKALGTERKPKVNEWVFKDHFEQQSELSIAHRKAFEFKYMCLYDHPLNDKPEGAYGPLLKFRNGVPVDGMYEVRVLAEAKNRLTPYSETAAKRPKQEYFRFGVRPGDTRLESQAHSQPIQPLLDEQEMREEKKKWYTFVVPLDKHFAPRFTFENGLTNARGTYQRVFKQHIETLPKSVRNGRGIVHFRNSVVKHGFLPHIRIHEVRIRGPIVDQWPTESRQQLLGGRQFEPEQAVKLIHRFATRAYRRPLRVEERESLSNFYRLRRKNSEQPEVAFRETITAVLCTPEFLYFKTSLDPDNVQSLSSDA